MLKKFLFSVITTFLLSVTAIVIAGPDEKEAKESVTITHGNGSDDGEGYVEIEVSVSAATSHLTKHAGDCAVDASNPDLLAEMVLLSLGNDCDYAE